MTPPAAAAPAVHPRRPLAPGRPYAPGPRRVSGPARRPRDEGSRPRRSPEYAGLALGVIEALRSLSTHPMLDRLIRGRIWIALVAFALIGIVTLQLGLLKLNAGIGHALQRETSLQRENAALSIENSELAAGDVVESSAGRLGMEMVPVGALRFLTARPRGDASRAASALATPLSTTAAPTPAPEASSSSTSSEASTEGSGPSSESQASASSSESESKEASTAPSESGAAGAAGASTEAHGEQSTSSAAPSGGPAEPSGGTQAQSTGR